MTESMIDERPYCDANAAPPFHVASIRCCDKWWCAGHIDMHRRADHKEKCACDGCGSGRAKFSIYCEQHDRDAQGNMAADHSGRKEPMTPAEARATASKCAIEECGWAQTKFSIYCSWHYPEDRRNAGELPDVVEGRKDDAGKTRWDLIPWSGLEQVADVLAFGAKKYAPDNWRKVDGWRWRYFRAGIGHMISWVRGEKLDPESGCHHLAHAACCCLFMLELDQ